MLSIPKMRRMWAVIALECVLGVATGCAKSSTAQAPPSEINAPPIPPPSGGDRLQPTDLYHLRSVGDVQLSPDGSRVAYAITNSDRPGRPYTQVWVMNLETHETRRLGATGGSASAPRWSPDGKSIAFIGRDGQRSGLTVAKVDGSAPKFIAPVEGTNHPLPTSGS